MKRTLSLLIALVMVLSMVPAVSLASEPVTVYLDPQNGSDANTGTEAAPVQSFEAAYGLLQNTGGTVVMLSSVTYSKVTTLPACDYPVTVTSKTGAEGICSNSHIIVGGDTTFRNMSFTLLKANTGTTICGGGHKLVMDEGITVNPFVNDTDAYYFCLEGGNPNAAVDSTDLTVKSGQYRYIYAGGYTKNVTGDVKLTMTGGITANLAATRTGTISGDVEMAFSGTAKVTGNIYGGAATSGKLSGSNTITLGQGAGFKGLYTGSNGSGSIAGISTVILDGFDGSFTTLKGTGGSGCTGTLGGSRLLVKSGTLNSAPTAFDTVDIDIPQGKTLTLSCDFAADTLKADGTLCFSGVTTLTTAAVTGEVNCAIEGESLQNHIYITAPAGSAILFPAASGVTELSGKWVNQNLAAFTGLVLKTDPANNVTLYTGLYRSGDTDEHTAITPYFTETRDGTAYYYYPNLLGGYYVRGTRSGYIGVYQNIYMSPEETATATVETVTLEKKGTGGYVPSTVYINTDEVMENEDAWKSELSMFPKYAPYMKNPVFQEGRDPHRMTTGQELADAIAGIVAADEDMYLYSLGQSAGKQLDIPVVILTRTDLSGADTLEEATQALSGSKKLKVLYRAHMHGNEPAGGEGALAMLYYLQEAFGEEILDEIDLVMIPRMNPDGAYLYQRRLQNDIDPNRDQLVLNTQEMQLLQNAFLDFDPEVVIDGHERMWNNPWGDMQISSGFTPMNSQAFSKLGMALCDAAFRELEANGLCGYYYAGNVNGSNPSMGSSYYAMTGTMYMLLESRGIHESDEAMERRVAGHMSSATAILTYLSNNAAQVKELIAAERSTIAQNGATYEESDVFILDTNKRTTTDADREIWGSLNNVGQTVNWGTGEVTYPVRYPGVEDVVARSRTAPTAYVLPANLQNIGQILALMELQGLPYTYLPEGTTIPLQSYSGDATSATVNMEKPTRFDGGCYVFTMNHRRAQILASLMEPDHTNVAEYSGSLLQAEKVAIGDIYRYARNLNGEGFVDYTVTDGDFVEITVYLDGENGLDTNDGITETTAVKTLEQAYALMSAALEDASADSQATLVILGLYELGATRIYMPKVSYHVTITGKTAADGLSYTGGNSQETRIVDIGGDTTFRNMTIHSNSSGSFNHLNANGHRLVIDEGVTCTTKKANCYFTLAGGGYSNTVTSTDLTVRSGKWRTIYAGGYIGAVTGQAKLEASGCWVYQNVASAYRGNVGSVDMKLSNITVSGQVDTSAIYAGTIMRKDAKQGEILGDVNITLGENVEALAVYAASREAGIISGTVTILADGVDLSKLPVYAKCSTTTGTTAAAVLKLGSNVTTDVTLDAALPLDLCGYDITGSLTVDGTLVVKDSATDDYDVSDGVYGEITGTVIGTLAAADGYVAAADGFHKFGGQYISGVSLRPGNAGIYYTATFLCDEVLADALEMGVAVSLADMPGADFATDEDTLYTVGTTGVMIENILKGNTEDADRGIMDIYAASYVKLQDGTVLVSENEVAYSLYDVLCVLKTQNPEAFHSFCTTWNITSWF